MSAHLSVPLDSFFHTIALMSPILINFTKILQVFLLLHRLSVIKLNKKIQTTHPVKGEKEEEKNGKCFAAT